jgi:hypothetical protein
MAKPHCDHVLARVTMSSGWLCRKSDWPEPERVANVPPAVVEAY